MTGTLQVFDLDGDGKDELSDGKDILTVTKAPNSASLSISTTAKTFSNDAVLVDINNDGREDILDSSSGQYQLSDATTPLGSGTWQPLGFHSSTDLFTLGCNDGYYDANGHIVPGSCTIVDMPFPLPVYVGDFNGDGLKDVIASRAVIDCSTTNIASNCGRASESSTIFHKYPFNPTSTSYFGNAIVTQQVSSYRTVVLDYKGSGADSVYQIPTSYGFGSSDVLVLDTNGDGRKEIAFAQVFDTYALLTILHPSDNGEYLQVAADSRQLPAAVAKELHDSRLKNALVEDYDHDGRDDLVFPGLGGLFLSRSLASSESFEWHDNAFPALVGTFVLADVDGDGDREWASSALQQVPGASSKVVHPIYRGTSAQTGLLVSVTNGVGKTSLITYGSNYQASPLSSEGGNSPSNVVQYLKSVGPLVSDIREVQYLPVHDQITVNIAPHRTYKYAGAVAGLGGRGFLGFYSQEVDDEDNNQLVTYRQSTTFSDVYSGFPLAGLPSAVVTNADTSGTGVGPWQNIDTANSWSVGSSALSGTKFVKLDATETLVSDVYHLDDYCARHVNPYCAPVQLLSVKTGYTYDPFGNISKQFKTSTVSHDNFTDVTAALTTYQSDSKNWLVSNPMLVIAQDIYNGVFETRTDTYDYYPNGLLWWHKREPSTPELYLMTTYDRDPVVGNITKVHATDHDGNERTMEITYDSRKLYMASLTNAKGQPTELQYDETSGRLATRMDPNLQIEQWTYDFLGRSRQYVSPTDTISYSYLPATATRYPLVGYSWDAFTVVQESAAFGTSSSTFDQFGRKTQVKGTGLDGKTISSEFGYDIRGRQTIATMPHMLGDTMQGATAYSYDGLGRVTSITPPGAQATTYTYTEVGPSADYAWLFSGENNGALRAVIKQAPGNQQSISVMDYAGRPLRSIQADALPGSAAAGPPSAGVAASSYNYGPFGTITSVTDPDGDVTTMLNDRLGRRTSTVNANTGTHHYTYNTFGEVVDDTDGNGTKYCHYYDKLGRETELRQSAVSGTCDPGAHMIASWDYDGSGDNEIGRLVKAFHESSPGSTTGTTQYYHYEPIPPSGRNTGRLSSVEQYVQGMSDALVTSVDYEGPRVRNVHYPAAGSVSFDVQYDYDPVGNLTAVRDATTKSPYWEVKEYQDGLRVASELFGNGVKTRTDYLAVEDCANLSLEYCIPGTPRMLTTSLPNSPGIAPLQQLTYDYNASGNVKTRQSFNPATIEQFQTDGLGRLRSYELDGAAGTMKTESYGYTASGDITAVTKTGAGATSEQYIYEATRPHLVSSRQGMVYQHDNNGSQIWRSGPDVTNGQQTLDYNDFSMPWSITSGSDVTLLEYDASGTRVAKRNEANGVTTIYAGDLYDCVGLSAPPPASFNCFEHHYKVYAGSQLVAQVTRDTAGGTTETRYIHPDLLGSTTTVTDELGAVAEQRQYDAFGKTTSDFVPSRIRPGYTGQEEDLELGLINMKGRLYDPALRRFTTADPYVNEPLNPQGLNRYSYVQNNPMNLVDPSGFDSCPPVTYETEGGSVTVYPTGCGQSGNGEPTTSQQQNQQSQTTNQQNSQNSQQTTQYYADQSQQRTAEQRQAQNMLPNDAKDLGFTNPYTSPNPNDLNNGGPRLGDAYPDRLAQAVPIGITPGLPIPLPLPPVPTPKQMERIVDATWDFVKWVAQNPLTGLTIAISVANQIKDALSTASDKPTSPNQLQKQVEKGQQPRGVDRVDPGNPNTGEMPHVHLNDGRALNQDGTWKHGSGNVNNAVKEWLQQNGWKAPP